MSARFIGVTLLALGLLAGCAGGPERRGAPAPVAQPGEAGPPRPAERPGPAVTVRPYEPAPAARREPVHSGAVVALLDTAERQRRGGDTAGAVATTERALRIEPRNAHLWNRLAHLRFDQARYGMAADIAAKSTDLAAGDTALERDNWQLIARCRRALGDSEGARRAERSARELR